MIESYLLKYVTILTFDAEVGGGALRIADAVGHLAEVLARVVRLDGVDDERAVLADGDPGLQGGHLPHGGSLAVPAHRDIPGHGLSLAGEYHFFALVLRLVGRGHLCFGNAKRYF